jgi:hypothetical protein
VRPPQLWATETEIWTPFVVFVSVEATRFETTRLPDWSTMAWVFV